MPEPAFDPEKETRQKSVDIVAAGDTPSFQICTLCPGATRTPTLHELCTVTHDSTTQQDKGKNVVDDDYGVSGVDKVNLAEASTSAAAETPENNSSASSSQHDQDSKLKNFGAILSLDEPSGKKRPAIATAEGNARIVVACYGSDHPEGLDPDTKISPSAVHKGKRKAEDIDDGSEAPSKFKKETAMNDTEAYWHNHEVRPFRDLPDQAGTSSGLGDYMSRLLMQEPERDADQTNMQQQVEETSTVVLRLGTFGVATFGIDYLSRDGNVTAFLEEHQVPHDPELGFEGLLRGHDEERMDDE